TPRRFCEERLGGAPYRMYMEAYFDDLRLCITCGDDGKSKLEVQFAASCVAHLGLGRVSSNSNQLSLLGEPRSFADIYFDDGDGRWEIAPAGVQGLVGAGDEFAHLDGPDCKCHAAILQALLPLIRRAATTVLRRNSASVIPLQNLD